MGSIQAVEKIRELAWQKRGQDAVEVLNGQAPSFRFGNNGKVTCASATRVAVPLDGVTGGMDVAVHEVPGQPVLLSIKSLRALGAVIDYERDEMLLKHVRSRKVVSSGHHLFPTTDDIYKNARLRSSDFVSLLSSEYGQRHHGDGAPSQEEREVRHKSCSFEQPNSCQWKSGIDKQVVVAEDTASFICNALYSLGKVSAVPRDCARSSASPPATSVCHAVPEEGEADRAHGDHGRNPSNFVDLRPDDPSPVRAGDRLEDSQWSGDRSQRDIAQGVHEGGPREGHPQDLLHRLPQHHLKQQRDRTRP